MKKLLLASAALALSSTFAFADGSHSGPAPTLNQTFSLTQTIGNTSTGGEAKNKFFGVQAQVPVNSPKSTLNQSMDVTQTIGNTSKGGEAINKATVIQAQVPLNFGGL